MKRPAPHLIFRAFADPIRLRILYILSRGERCVCDIMTILRMDQPKVSRHLATLRRSGLVAARREGLWMHYRLVTPAAGFLKKLLGCVDDCVGQDPVCRRAASWPARAVARGRQRREPKAGRAGCRTPRNIKPRPGQWKKGRM